MSKAMEALMERHRQRLAENRRRNQDEQLCKECREISDIAEQVEQLHRQKEEAVGLLGEILATLAIPRNRESLSQCPAGAELLKIADAWMDRALKIKGIS